MKRAHLAPLGWFMGGVETRTKGAAVQRVLVVESNECSICIALDVVEGVHPLHTAPDDLDRSVTWAKIVGNPEHDAAMDSEGWIVVVRHGRSRVGLRVDRCVGIRGISLLARPPVPTRLLEPGGEPVCHLLEIDERIHFLLDPRALRSRRDVEANAAAAAANGEEPRGASAPVRGTDHDAGTDCDAAAANPNGQATDGASAPTHPARTA